MAIGGAGGAAAGQTASGRSGGGSKATGGAGASSAGRPSTPGGSTAGGRANGGSVGLGDAGDDAGGVAGASAPPGPGPDGKSPYVTECHGDSLDCGDPSLRCLGIRDTMQVFGYSCSNTCQSAAECSTAESGAEASVDCVDFVSSKHCLLVCKDEQRGDRDCPTGMSCYVFPGSLIGYCLWQ